MSDDRIAVKLNEAEYWILDESKLKGMTLTQKGRDALAAPGPRWWAETVGLAGEPQRTEFPRAVPPGYHASGRYMAMQGGSNTKCRPAIWADRPSGFADAQRVCLSDYFDRISQAKIEGNQ